LTSWCSRASVSSFSSYFIFSFMARIFSFYSLNKELQKPHLRITLWNMSFRFWNNRWIDSFFPWLFTCLKILPLRMESLLWDAEFLMFFFILREFLFLLDMKFLVDSPIIYNCQQVLHVGLHSCCHTSRHLLVLPHLIYRDRFWSEKAHWDF
jgi:hypothetical protein